CALWLNEELTRSHTRTVFRSSQRRERRIDGVSRSTCPFLKTAKNNPRTAEQQPIRPLSHFQTIQIKAWQIVRLPEAPGTSMRGEDPERDPLPVAASSRQKAR